MKRKSSIFVSGGIFFPFSANFIPEFGKKRKRKRRLYCKTGFKIQNLSLVKLA